MSGNEGHKDGESLAQEDKVVNIYEGNDPILQEDIVLRRGKDGEQVVHLFDDIQSIEVLKRIINKIKDDELHNFIVIAQHKNNEEEREATGQENGNTFYFYGKDTCTTLLGLAQRITQIIGNYMDD